MAEVHFMGQIIGASGFGRQGLLCKVRTCSPRQEDRRYQRERRQVQQSVKHPQQSLLSLCLVPGHRPHEPGSACDWPGTPNSAAAQWGIEADEDTWDALEGYQKGQTQTDYPRDDDIAIWAHPIDIHYQCLVLLCSFQPQYIPDVMSCCTSDGL